MPVGVAGTDLGGLRVDLGAIPLGGVDSNGVNWALTTFEGWDSPDVRSEYTEREADHGAWASPVYLGARPLTLTGTVTAPDRMTLEDAMERIRSAASLTDTTLVVYELAGSKQAVVRRSGKLLLTYVTDRIATYSVMVTAGDPRRYSTTLQSVSTGLPVTSGGLVLSATLPWTISATTVAGQFDAVNGGTFETRPVLVVDGPIVAPQVIAQMPDGTVRFLNYSQDLASGDELIIDTDAHTVTLNGTASRRRFLALPNGWPTIPAGSTVTFQFRSSTYNASALLTARWRSAWM